VIRVWLFCRTTNTGERDITEAGRTGLTDGYIKNLLDVTTVGGDVEDGG